MALLVEQTGELIVRPTSAVRRYLNEDTDALTAARQLNTDAVLEGSVQRADDRLRVSVNLLRTRVRGVLLGEFRLLRRIESEVQARGDLLRHRILYGEDVSHTHIEVVSPQRRAVA